jgi:hypothetical protein
MMRGGPVVVCVAFAVGIVAACGGASDTGLFGGSGGTSDAGTTKDGAPDAPGQEAAAPNVVACMGTPGCKVGAQACCRKNNSFSCTPLGSCNGMGALEIPCDKQKDCGTGNVCCLIADSQGIATQIACRTAADCTAQQRSAEMCDPNAPNTCPTMLTCQPSATAIPGYSICR